MTARYDVAVVGGGIVGLATARELVTRHPRVKVVVLDKELDVARHQTGHNSGVIHSGIYYKPGSFKARFARAGSASMVAFCEEHGIAHEVCGKVIVATAPDELPRLDALHQRGLENGLAVRKIGPEEVRELEPHVAAIAGVHVPSTGIADYVGVTRTYARLVQEAGGELRTGVTVTGVRSTADGAVVETDAGDFEAALVVNCAGLHSDRIARKTGVDPRARIVPFRGEYFELVPERRHLVKNLIYPVPNPDFPFLGVHFTRMIDGTVHAGPNAVLAMAREGYEKTDVNLKDLAETLAFPGFWRLASRNYKEGAKEVWRSLSKAAFVRSLQRLIPEVRPEDVVPTHAGIRAQALTTDGALVDDFLIVRGDRSVHVCNAPSPAATASLEIGTAVVDQLPIDLLPRS
jgi:L-2-hydroxyglutarate oxidase